MANGSKCPVDDESIASSDGSTTQRLRDTENAAVMSRRGLLWRAGLATAAGFAARSILDVPAAQAAETVNGNFVLATGNSANAQTTLTAATTVQQFLVIDGSPMGATDTTMVIAGPSNGGKALQVNQGAGPSGTVGLALGISAAGGSSGLSASSGSGVGVSGSSGSGTGVVASSTSGTALSVQGKAHFSRSGSSSVAQGSKTKTVNVSGMTASSLVLVTLQTSVSGVYVTAAVPGSGKFTVHLNKNTPAATKFAWFVLN
jgi:hypothetical protein